MYPHVYSCQETKWFRCGEGGGQGKIVVEEHFALEETVADSAGFSPKEDWPELKARLLDIQERRLREMDSHGIEMMLLSLNAPAVQAIPDLKVAAELSSRANDFL